MCLSWLVRSQVFLSTTNASRSQRRPAQGGEALRQTPFNLATHIDVHAEKHFSADCYSSTNTYSTASHSHLDYDAITPFSLEHA